MTTINPATEFKQKLKDANNTLLVNLQGLVKNTYQETEHKTHEQDEQELSSLMSELNKL